MKLLSEIGHFFSTGLKDEETITAKLAPLAIIVGKVIGGVEPALGAAVTAAAQLALNTEVQFAASQAAASTGPAKAASVLSVLGPILTDAIAGSSKAGATANSLLTEIVGFLNTDPQIFIALGSLVSQLTANAAPSAAGALPAGITSTVKSAV